LGALAVLLWPSAVAQFWNVPGKGIPWKVAIGRMDDREYERQSTPDRDLVALFDRETPPGTLAASGPHERAWLTDGRDLTPFWELDFRLQIDGPPPEQPAETLTAVRAAGVSWVLALTEDPQLANLPYLREMVEAYGVPVGSTPHGTLYRLPAEPPGDVE
jgi:hypothetical protein